MKKTASVLKKLKLRKENIRALATAQLTAVAGGSCDTDASTLSRREIDDVPTGCTA